MAINEHCMEQYSYKKEKRTPIERVAESIDSLIVKSSHDIELTGLKWQLDEGRDRRKKKVGV